MPRDHIFPNWNIHALLSCDEMRKAEALSCAKGPPDLYGLMQNAGRAVAQAVMERWKPCRVIVLCGPGNNGGDGFVAAEALRAAGWPVVVGAVAADRRSPDAARAAAAWQGKTRALDVGLLGEAELVIDALFGTGLQRALGGDLAQLVDHLNALSLPVVAADFPSGVDGDTGRLLGTAVRAEVTVTFFRKKRGHVLQPGASLCGEILVAGTGMDDSVLEEINPSVAENSVDLWRDRFPKFAVAGHKYSRGHALVYGGPVMTGAARLAARAAQRIGAGMVTLAAPECAIPVYAAALESAIVRQADTSGAWREMAEDPKKNALLIGPGAGLDHGKKEFVLAALSTRKPCVLDADALTLFAGAPDVLFEALHPACVLTPHEGEFQRLFGKSVDMTADKLTRAKNAAEATGVVVLLKGADTVIAGPEGMAIINHNAPPWLATAGAGDVLSGMILGLLAQGMPAFAAVAAAAYLHGNIATEFGPGLIAEDVIEGLPAALKGLSALA